MNQVGRRFRDSDFSFPGDVGQIACHADPRGKGGHIYRSGCGSGDKLRQFFAPFSVDRTMARDCLDEENPVFRGIMDDNIRHLAVHVHFHAECGKTRFVEISPLLAGIAHIQNLACRNKVWNELVSQERKRELDLYKRYAQDPEFKRTFDSCIMRLLSIKDISNVIIETTVGGI